MMMLRPLKLPYLDTAPDVWRAAISAMRPRPDYTPAQWAEKYRHIKDEGASESPGPWDNSKIPVLVPIMNTVKEAIETGKRGMVLMKPAQVGGSEAMVNVVGWLLDLYGGPVLYMISKDDLAREFSRERFSYMIEKAEPLRIKQLTGRGSGELVHIKRFVDGKLVVVGSKSVLNLQSTAYRWVLPDEVDSMADVMEGHGDPIKLAQARMGSFIGQTLIIPFAHPSKRSRGAGKLYYGDSDQRRAFVTCPHCADKFWLQWDHVKAVPAEGMTQAQADFDPKCYRYFAPCCGAEITDAQRFAMVSDPEKIEFKSILPPEEAAKKTWIGLHYSHLYIPHPKKTIGRLAEEYVEGLKDPAKMQVFFNKVLGDVYDAKIEATDADDWRGLVCIKGSPDEYESGTAPGHVQFITGGVDLRAEQIHYAMWGWGWLRAVDEIPRLLGWMIKAGYFRRKNPEVVLDASELSVVDALTDTAWELKDGRKLFCQSLFMDSGWSPTAVYDYCRRNRYKVFPVKGEFKPNMPALIRWSSGLLYKSKGKEVRDDAMKLGMINRYVSNPQYFGLVRKKISPFKRAEISIPLLNLPLDVSEDFIAQSSSEFLTVDEKNKPIWKARGANHLSDCNVLSWTAAKQHAEMGNQLPFDEKKPKKRRDFPGEIEGRESMGDPSLG